MTVTLLTPDGHDARDHTGVTGVSGAAEITDIPTTEMDDTLVLAPDGAGGVEFRAEAGGSGPAIDYSSNASDISITSDSWGAADTATDLVVPAVTGDLIEVGLFMRVGTEAPQVFSEIVSMVSASPVNAVSTGAAAPSGTTGSGASVWIGDTGRHSCGGVVFYTLQAGDLSGGNVTLRWYARRTSGTKTIEDGARLYVKNWGQ
jgi:hypothetical protein